MDYQPQTEYVNIIHCILLFGKDKNGGIFFMKYKYIEFTLDREIKEKLDRYCKENDLTIEETVNLAITKLENLYLNGSEGKND